MAVIFKPQTMNISTQNSSLNDNDLLATIWTKPKLALEYILSKCPKKYLIGLITLGGIANTINGTQVNIAQHKIFSIAILVIAVFIGALSGWVYSYIYASLLSWTGEWINGRGKMSQFITVISWSMVPSISSLILLIPKFIIFGDKLFNIDIRELNQVTVILYYSFNVIEFILSIWTIIILITGISLIQKFNIWKAILNLILPVLVIMIPIFIIIGIRFFLK